MDVASQTIAPVPARPGLARALRIVAPLTTLSVLVQAVFAGRGLFLDTENLTVHGGIGNLTLLVALQTALVLLAGFRHRTGTVLVVSSLTLLALVIVQLGLGYSGREGGQAAAWHVPNGVLIFGIASGIAATLNGVRVVGVRP